MKIKREVKIGIFAVLMLLCLYWGINFLKGRDLFNINYVYYAKYEQVNGVVPSSPVKIRGFKVGVITDIMFDPSRSDKIVLELTIKSKFRIPADSRARIFSDGLLGGKAIEIEMGDSPRFLADRDTIATAVDRDFLEVAGSELDFLKTKINEITTELTFTLRSVNRLLESNAANVNATLSNLAGISGSLNTIVTSETDNLRGIVANLNSLSATLRRSSNRIDNIITNVDSFTDSLAHSNVPEMVANLSATLGELNTALAGVNEGEGTLGKLINDRELYDSLTDASANLSALLEDLRKNPGKYVHISVFGRRSAAGTPD